MYDIILDPMDYDGSQLHHAFAYEQKGVLGDSIVSFIGAANVKDHLVDLEDSLKNDFISSKKMLHFIIEIFNISITESVLWQRVLVKEILDVLRVSGRAAPTQFYRKGDDIMITLSPLNCNEMIVPRKMSVSIATLSRFSGLVHLGLNIDVGESCPVPALGLYYLGYNDIEIEKFQRTVLTNFINEFNSIKKATYKVIEV